MVTRFVFTVLVGLALVPVCCAASEPPTAATPDARVVERDRLWQLAQRQLAEGKPGEAIAAAEKSLKLEQEISTATSVQVPQTLAWLAAVYVEAERLDDALAAAQRCQQLCERLYGTLCSPAPK